jgi:hypothetical protein
MTIQFDVRKDAPLGSAPEIEGSASNAYALAHEATVGLVDQVDRIRRATDDGLNAAGKERAVAKLRLERQATLDRAAKLVESEGTAIDSEAAQLRDAAGLTAPPADSADAIRHAEIRRIFETLDQSARLEAIRGGDGETLLALYHSPKVAGLLAPLEAEQVEKMLLRGHDAARFDSIAARRVAHKSANYAIEAATRFADVRTGVNAEAVRERIAGLRK